MGEQRMSIPYVALGRRLDAYAVRGTSLEALCGVLEARVEVIYPSSAVTGDLSRT